MLLAAPLSSCRPPAPPAATGDGAGRDRVDADAARRGTADGPNAAAIDRFRRPDALVAALDLRPGQVVADVGAGGGYLTLRLAAAVGPTGRVLATDVDPELLAALRERARAAGLGIIEARAVRPDEPGLPTGGCDRVLLAQVDHLLPDRVAWLRALGPSLRPGAWVAVTNREPFRAPLEQAARAAGYRVVPLPVDLPGQFLIALQPPSP